MAEKKEYNLKQDQLPGILDLLNDGVYIVNRDYDVEYANASIVREFGSVGNKKCFEYLCGRDGPCPECKLEEVLTGKTIRSEWRSVKNNKIYAAVDSPLKNPDGSISMLKIIHDITESRRTRQQIRDLSRFPEENPFPVLRLSADGTILYSNMPGRVLLDEWQSQVGQKVPENWCALVTQALKSQRYYVEEIRCAEKIFSFAIAPFAESGYVNLYGRDVTANRKAQKKVKESYEELSRFNQMAVGRELRMIELKKEINELCVQAGLPPRYAMDPQEEMPLTDEKQHDTEDV